MVSLGECVSVGKPYCLVYGVFPGGSCHALHLSLPPLLVSFFVLLSLLYLIRFSCLCLCAGREMKKVLSPFFSVCFWRFLFILHLSRLCLSRVKYRHPRAVVVPIPISMAVDCDAMHLVSIDQPNALTGQIRQKKHTPDWQMTAPLWLSSISNITVDHGHAMRTFIP